MPGTRKTPKPPVPVPAGFGENRVVMAGVQLVLQPLVGTSLSLSSDEPFIHSQPCFNLSFSKGFTATGQLFPTVR